MTAMIHKDSSACAKSELDLFILPPTQTAIEKGFFVEFNPISNIRDGGPLEFLINGGSEDYIDLSSSYLYVKAKIVAANGTTLGENEPVAPVNLMLHSLFSQVDVSLNERNISPATNTYPYRAYIETLLNYGEDAKKSLLSCSGFFKDNNLETVNPLATTSINEGLKKRFEQTKNSQSFDLMGPLHCDIFQQNRLMLNLVDLKVKLIRSKPEFCLVSSKADANYKVIIEQASLFIRKVKVSPGVSLGHAKALEISSAKYPIERVMCKTYSVSQGSWSFTQDNVFLGTMPKRIIIGCLENSAMSGQYGKNPYLFNNFDMSSICVYLDSQPIPSKAIELNFKKNNYIRGYHSLFNGFNQDKGLYLSREEYLDGHTLFAFDLSADLCDGPHLHLLQQGNLRVEIKFAEALTQTISVLIYGLFESVVEVTKSRHVLCDFAN